MIHNTRDIDGTWLMDIDAIADIKVSVYSENLEKWECVKKWQFKKTKEYEDGTYEAEFWFSEDLYLCCRQREGIDKPCEDEAEYIVRHIDDTAEILDIRLKY